MTSAGYVELLAELAMIGRPTCWFAGRRDEETVQEAERLLGSQFGPALGQFVRVLGAGSVGPVEFFGVVDNQVDDGSVPDGVWLALEARRDWGLPSHLFPVYFDGGVDYFVVNLSDPGEAVLVWRPGVSREGDQLELASESFASFFEEMVRGQLSSLG